MARGRKPKGQVETALVTRPVVEATFDDESDATSRALTATSEQNVKLVELMMGSYKDQILAMKIMSDAFTDSLRAQVEATKAQQELLDKKDDRKLKREREKRHDELVEQGLREVFALLPVLANKFGKGPMLSAKEAALIQPFIQGLSKEELKKIWEAMAPANRAVFVEILKAVPDHPDQPIKEPPPNGTSH